MADITAAMVKELRERTNVGMMDCKRALQASNGDMEEAITALRESGQAKAAKKSARIAAEGLVYVSCTEDSKSAVIIEINCETDFVAREESFRDFCKSVAELCLNNSCEDIAKVSELKLGEQTVEETRLALVAKLGENISLRRAKIVKAESGVLGTYMHGAAEGARIATIVEVDNDKQQIAFDVAMHIAAMNPEFMNSDDVPQERMDKEKEIFMTQAREASGDKPEEILEKIIAGKLKKYLQEITLLGQQFIKDGNLTIAELLKKESTNVKSFIRYEVGEGIEKKVDDFVGEVMAQAKS